ncbi:MAG: DUF3795 domain-containing protein [Limnochordales bacterium]|nr:hypothetical protein [Bacillota bacterium]
MASALLADGSSAYQPRPGDIVSRCGLLCNTCPAYIAGVCPGCPNLAAGECVIRDCAERKGTSCLDCQADSCYHFEAYAWRRKTMNALAKRYMRLTGMSRGAKRAGCGAGGCGCAAGDCAGCGSRGGCPAARLAEKLAEVLAAG